MNTAVITDANKAIEIFDIDILKGFLYTKADMVIESRECSRTLLNEVGEVARFSAIAYIKDGVNYYSRRRAFSEAELTEAEREQRTSRMFTKAAKKLIFLNSVCKNNYSKQGFIKAFVDTTSVEECKSITDAFMYLIDNYDEF